MPLTNEQIEAALRVCEAATPGPWEFKEVWGDAWWALVHQTAGGKESRLARVVARPDGEFMESARAQYAEVLEELLKARKRIADLEAEIKDWKEASKP